MAGQEPDFSRTTEKMPVLFVGHGSPTNAIEENEFSLAWAETAKALPRPQAIVCVSAHWESEGAKVTAMERPRTIHDFSGFPRALYEMLYPAPGSPVLARLLRDMVSSPVALDLDWGLDHGAWSVLCRMYPQADVPVVQLSLDYQRTPAQHYELGRALKGLRQRGVLIVGSGGIVHNLQTMRREERALEWAIEFDEAVRRLIVAGDHQSIVNYERLGSSAALSVPTNEHFLPLLYVLGLMDEGESARFFTERVIACSLSMRSFVAG